MPEPTIDSSIAEDRRKEIFLALVESQDQGVSVTDSRVLAAKQFEISEAQVRSIEREGIDNDWPPL